MKKLLILLVCYFYSANIKAQGISVSDENGQKVTKMIGTASGRNGHSTYFRYKGSVFYNDEPQLAKFNIAGGKMLETPIIFIPLANEFIAEINGQKVNFTKTYFTFNSQHFIFIKGQYYELLNEKTLADGEIKLLKKYVCRIKTQGYKDKAGASFGAVFDGEFIKSEEYYFQFFDEKPKQFELNEKSIIKAIGDKKPKLVEYLSNNASKINNIDDLRRILIMNLD